MLVNPPGGCLSMRIFSAASKGGLVILHEKGHEVGDLVRGGVVFVIFEAHSLDEIDGDPVTLERTLGEDDTHVVISDVNR
jgi:hypothetical protein